jgi:hypothetical protein
MSARWFKSVLMVLALAAPLSAQSRQSLVETIQDASSWKEWKLSKPPTVYDTAGIDEMGPDIAASLKLYGVKGVSVQEWKSAQGSVRATLFEMLDSPAGYGFYTSQRPATAKPTPVLIGGDSFQTAGSLYFWQSNYVVRIDGRSAAADTLAHLLSEKILGRSQKPTVSEHLPPAHLIQGSEKYLLTAEAVDRSVTVKPDQFGFDESAEAATALYDLNGSTARLLLLMYPNQHVAKKYADKIEVGMIPPEFLKRDGPLVAIVYATTDGNTAKSILDGVSHEYNITFNESNPVASYAKMILAIFKLIGIGLLLSVVAGVAFGGLRLLVKAWFPNKVFDRVQDIEIIQLKLDQSLTRKELTE